MRVRFKGKPTPEEFASEISDLLAELSDLGVDEIAGANLYINLRAHGHIVELQTRAGSKVDILDLPDRTATGHPNNSRHENGLASKTRQRNLQQ